LKTNKACCFIFLPVDLKAASNASVALYRVTFREHQSFPKQSLWQNGRGCTILARARGINVM
jgi:hypothetical protein